MIKRILFFSFSLVFLTLTLTTPIEAKRSYGSYSRPYREYKYSTPRNQIPVPKSNPVRPYFRKDGTYVQPHFRAPYGSLRPYYQPGYPRYKF